MTKVIGVQCQYVGPDVALRNRRLTITGVARGRNTATGEPYIETDNGEFEHEPVLPEEMVQVRVPGEAKRALIRATELDEFRHLAPRLVKLDARIEEGIAQELFYAARHLGRSVDALLNDAVAAHVRALGVDRSRWTTLVGLPALG